MRSDDKKGAGPRRKRARSRSSCGHVREKRRPLPPAPSPSAASSAHPLTSALRVASSAWSSPSCSSRALFSAACCDCRGGRSGSGGKKGRRAEEGRAERNRRRERRGKQRGGRGGDVGAGEITWTRFSSAFSAMMASSLALRSPKGQKQGGENGEGKGVRRERENRLTGVPICLTFPPPTSPSLPPPHLSRRTPRPSRSLSSP